MGQMFFPPRSRQIWSSPHQTANLMFLLVATFYKRPLMVVKCNGWAILIVKGGSTKGQAASSSEPMGNVYIPIFVTSPDLTSERRGWLPRKWYELKCPTHSTRFSISDFWPLLFFPFRVSFPSAKNIKGLTYLLKGNLSSKNIKGYIYLLKGHKRLLCKGLLYCLFSQMDTLV